MLKKIRGTFAIVTALLLLSSVLRAQDQSSSGTSSPYSRYGIGTLNGYSLGRTAAMGGIGIGTRYGFQINSGNPASYTAVDSMTFLTEFGARSTSTIYESGDKKNGGNVINFNYLAFSFPIKKWWATAFGLMPLSDKGYNILSTQGSSNDLASTSFTGKGTLSKAFIGNAFKIGNNLSVGLNAWYLFGTLSDSYYLYFPYDAGAYDYLSESSLTVHNFGLTTGMQYYWKNKKNNVWTLGLVFEPKQNMSTKYTILEERVLFRNSSTNIPITDTLRHVESTINGLALPLSFGVGFSYSIKNKIIFGADIYHQKWSQTSFLGSTSQYMTNSTRYSSGFEIAPDEYSIRNYWSRVRYRLGCFYDNSYLAINGKQINGYGVTFGLGMPLSRSLSSLNISAELGRLGTVQNNLIRESYAKISFHFLLHDRWFIKRKFD
jgi:hypothetical protein